MGISYWNAAILKGKIKADGAVSNTLHCIRTIVVPLKLIPRNCLSPNRLNPQQGYHCLAMPFRVNFYSNCKRISLNEMKDNGFGVARVLQYSFILRHTILSLAKLILYMWKLWKLNWVKADVWCVTTDKTHWKNGSFVRFPGTEQSFPMWMRGAFVILKKKIVLIEYIIFR